MFQIQNVSADRYDKEGLNCWERHVERWRGRGCKRGCLSSYKAEEIIAALSSGRMKQTEMLGYGVRMRICKRVPHGRRQLVFLSNGG